MSDNAGDVRVVFVTAPDIETANKLARAVLEARAAACVNILQDLESQYWWKDRIEQTAELLLIMKTTAGAFDRLRQIVVDHHPADCPEILSVACAEGSPPYLAWLRGEVRDK